jgi:phenylpropionate dioxygenase-like ring-hydroxylating dioxygenase large terminal subunit
MGKVMRRYWVPVMLSSEISEADGPQVRVKILGERLLAFRDSQGRPGLINEFCAHRGASLFFGRNEESGIRCSYHGWKFDLDGKCVDLPSLPSYAEKISINAYPCVELGGVVWAYMGPPELKPEPPALEWCKVPDSHRFVSKRLQECNYLQAMEGGIDTTHAGWVHRFEMEPNRFACVNAFSVHPSDARRCLTPPPCSNSPSAGTAQAGRAPIRGSRARVARQRHDFEDRQDSRCHHHCRAEFAALSAGT